MTFPELQEKGSLQIDFSDGGYRGWGTVIPVPEGNHTKYLFVTFDRRQTSDEDRWTYGALYLYQAKETTQGLEFNARLGNTLHQARIKDDFSPELLHFQRIGVQHYYLSQSLPISSMRFDRPVHSPNGNMYPPLNTDSTILVGGIHYPMSSYQIDLSGIGDRSSNYLYLGNRDGLPQVRVYFRREGKIIHVSADRGDGIIHSIGTIDMGKCHQAIVSFSSSCLVADADYIYIFAS